MILARETTKWDSELQPNHTYLMSDGMTKIYGYFKFHNPKEFMKFKNFIRFDKRYRTFKVIKKGIKDIQ
jgi:hypothetical protein